MWPIALLIRREDPMKPELVLIALRERKNESEKDKNALVTLT